MAKEDTTKTPVFVGNGASAPCPCNRVALGQEPRTELRGLPAVLDIGALVAAVVWDSYFSPSIGRHVRIGYESNNGVAGFARADIPQELFEQAGLTIHRGTCLRYSPATGAVQRFERSPQADERINEIKDYLRKALQIAFSEDAHHDSNI